jgi:hypothetical protein
MLGHKRGDVNRRLERKLHDEELRDIFPSPDISRVMKPRRMGWVGHVARMREK